VGNLRFPGEPSLWLSVERVRESDREVTGSSPLGSVRNPPRKACFDFL